MKNVHSVKAWYVRAIMRLPMWVPIAVFNVRVGNDCHNWVEIRRCKTFVW